MPKTFARFLLDTNVVSETAKTSPAQSVATWLATQRSVCISSVTLFELSTGIGRLRPGRRRNFLEAWMAELLADTVEVLPFDQAAALAASRLETRGRATGRTIELRDLFILGTADAAALTVATRNVDHFARFGVSVFDPFAGVKSL
jgi:predicted nucleic acid-binding protein